MGPIRIRDQSYIKQKNIESILRVLETCQPISRAEISRLTDMSPASITRIVNALLSLGLVSEGSVALSAGRGRKAINLRIRPDGMHTLGVCMESRPRPPGRDGFCRESGRLSGNAASRAARLA